MLDESLLTFDADGVSTSYGVLPDDFQYFLTTTGLPFLPRIVPAVDASASWSARGRLYFTLLHHAPQTRLRHNHRQPTPAQADEKIAFRQALILEVSRELEQHPRIVELIDAVQGLSVLLGDDGHLSTYWAPLAVALRELRTSRAMLLARIIEDPRVAWVFDGKCAHIVQAGRDYRGKLRCAIMPQCVLCTMFLYVKSIDGNSVHIERVGSDPDLLHRTVYGAQVS